MPQVIRKKCPSCEKIKRIEEFGWSRRKQRPTKNCKACWRDPAKARSIVGDETGAELALYYTDLRSMMMTLNEQAAAAAADGEPFERQIPTLADVWVSEMTEEVYRGIIKALIARADNGDVNASKLLLEERARRLGDPTAQSVQESFEELFKLDPLATGHDTE